MELPSVLSQVVSIHPMPILMRVIVIAIDSLMRMEIVIQQRLLYILILLMMYLLHMMIVRLPMRMSLLQQLSWIMMYWAIILQSAISL